MRNLALCLISILVLSGCTPKDTINDVSGLSIIPKPISIEAGFGEFKFDSETNIYFNYSDSKVEGIANYTIDRFSAAFNDIQLIKTENKKANGIQLLLSGEADSTLGDEGYLLNISKKKITITANTEHGIFSGIQTLFQLLPASVYGNDKIKADLVVPCLEVKDAPRYAYRGMHLDPCRHFISVDFTKKYLDYLAYHKMNVFHWHLTEDQGWRIEIKKYPKLTEVGSQRTETVIPPQLYDDSKNSYDGIPHGGFYTQEEIREIVAYASDRFIEVIPEIEMPGHSTQSLQSL